jgi:hypothetical protein
MQRAAGVEACPARRTHSLAIQVLTNCQLGPTGAAENCLLVEFSLQPNLSGMPRFHLVAVKAGIIRQAAFELYRDNIELAAIVRATGTPIYVNASYDNSGNREFHVTLPCCGPGRARARLNPQPHLPRVSRARRPRETRAPQSTSSQSRSKKIPQRACFATVELRVLTDPGKHRLFRPEEMVKASTPRDAAVNPLITAN